MGRLKKNTSIEELVLKRRQYSKTYYWKNKEKVDEKAKERYRQKKDLWNIQDNKSNE